MVYHIEALLTPSRRYLTLDDIGSNPDGTQKAEWSGYRSAGMLFSIFPLLGPFFF